MLKSHKQSWHPIKFLSEKRLTSNILIKEFIKMRGNMRKNSRRIS